MAIKTDNIVDPQQLKTQIGLALANGGVYAVETTKDIYITEVTENVSKQTVTNIVNSPSGVLGGELQFSDGRGFASTSNLRYTDALGLYLRGNMAMTGNINLTGSLVSSGLLNLGSPTMVKITGGNPGDVLVTDGTGNLSWVSAAGATYSNANVTAYLPTNTANIGAGNAALGNLVVANFYTGTLTTNAQPNITSVGPLTTLAVTGAVTTGPLTTTGPITATGNIFGGNLLTSGNISGLNLTINNIVSSGNLTLTRNIIAANMTANHFGDGGNLTNLNGANVVGAVANATHATVADLANSVAGANVLGVVANATHAVISDSALSVPGSGVVGNVNTAVFAYTTAVANSVAGANVIGEVAFAAVANSVAGANVIGEVAFAAVANSVAGANVTGTVANANYSAYAGNVTINAQPNITSVGTLTALTVAGISNLGPVGNLIITGGTVGQVITTDGAGNLTWTSAAGGGAPGGANTEIQFNDGGVMGGNSSFTFNKTTKEVSVFDLAVTGNVKTSLLPSSNITFDLGSSTQRWKDLWLSNTTIHMGPQDISATAGNITFSGNITATHLFGNANHANTSNVATLATSASTAAVANSVAGANVIGEVANAAYATVSGTAYSVDAANIVGTITASSINGANVIGPVAAAAVAYSVDAANIVGAINATTIAGANVIGAVTYATTANLVAGANVTGPVTLATSALTAAKVTANDQPNITSVGILNALTVTGDTLIGDNIPGVGYISLDATSIKVGDSNSPTTVYMAVDGTGVRIGDASTAMISVSSGGNIAVDSPMSVSVGNLKLSGGTSGQVLTTDGTGNLSWISGGGGYSDADVAIYLPTYTGNLAGGNLVLSGTTSRIEASGTIAILPSVGNTVDLGTTQLLGDITPVNTMGGNVGTAAKQFFDGHFVNLHADNVFGDGGNLANIQAANITGVVANAANANLANSSVLAETVTVNAQPNITSVGTLTSLGVSGDITGANITANANLSTANLTATGISTLGVVGNVKITGGTTGQVLSTDGTGNLSWSTTSLNIINNGTSEVSIPSSGGYVYLTVNGASWEVSDTMITSPDTSLRIWQDGIVESTANKLWMRSMTSEVALISTDGSGANSTTLSADFSSGLAVVVQNNFVNKTMRLDTDGNLIVPGSLLTTTDGVNDIGSIINKWGNLYLTDTIRLGLHQIQTVGDQIQFSGNISAYNIFGAVQSANTVLDNAQPNITSVGTLTSLAVSGDITTSGGASPAPSLSGFSTLSAENLTLTKISTLGEAGNVKITGGTLGQVLATDGTGNLSWTTVTGSSLKYTREFHVDSALGNDTTGDGSYNKPYATIMKAHSEITSGAAVILHLGTYTEDVTWTKTNTDIVGLSKGGAVNCTGTWTVGTTTPASVRINDIAFNGTFTQNGTGRLFFRRCQVNGAFTKSSGEYLQAVDTDFDTSVTINSAGSVVIKGAQTNGLTVNHASAVVNVSNLISGAVFVNTAGILLVNDSIVYSATTTTPAISSAAGSVTYMYNSSTATSAGTQARVSLAGFWTTGSSRYDVANSTITGTNLNTISYFDGITAVGQVLAPTVRTTPTLVASLPTAAVAGAGARAYVTNSTVNTFGATVVSGGAFAVPVYSNGTNWIVG